MKIILIIVIFLLMNFFLIISNNNIPLSNPNNFMRVLSLYENWFLGIFDRTLRFTGNIVLNR